MTETTQTSQRIYIFGASGTGKLALQYLNQQPEVEILGWLDNDPRKHDTTFEGLPVYNPAILKTLNDYDKVIIASMYHPQIRKQLQDDIGLSSDKYENIPINVAKGHIDFTDEQRYQLAHQLLFAVCNILQQEQVPFYVDHGTLLGIYRDKRLMPWDNDLDLAIHSEHRELAWTALNKHVSLIKLDACPDNRWALRHCDGVIEFPDEKRSLTRIYKVFNDSDIALTDKFTLDVIIKYPHQNQRYWLAGITTLSAPSEQTSKIRHYPYCEHRLPIPTDTEAYLTTLYQDWHTPVKIWDHSKYNNLMIG